MTINLIAALDGNQNAALDLEHMLMHNEISTDQIADSLEEAINDVVGSFERLAKYNALDHVEDTLITNKAFDDYCIYSETAKRSIIRETGLVDTIANNRGSWSVDSEISQFYTSHDDLIYSSITEGAIVGYIDSSLTNLYEAISGHSGLDIADSGEITLSNPVNVYVTYSNLYNILFYACEDYLN